MNMIVTIDPYITYRNIELWESNMMYRLTVVSEDIMNGDPRYDDEIEILFNTLNDYLSNLTFVSFNIYRDESGYFIVNIDRNAYVRHILTTEPSNQIKFTDIGWIETTSTTSVIFDGIKTHLSAIWYLNWELIADS